MGNSAKRDAKKIGRADLARKVLELRKAGASHDQIATQLGLANRSVSWKLFSAALREIIREPAQDVLTLELNRLDAMLLGCWTKAKSGDTQAIDRVIRIMDRRTAYLGLDQPKGLKVEVTRELESFLARARGEVDPDVFERLLAIAAGADSAPRASEDSSGDGGESDGGGEEPGDA